jgi:peptidyl-prolyl cis-trans isomerase B (cyclophilin B)
MAGKQSKREAKRAREAAREAARKRERQRTIQTAIVVLIALVIGGTIIGLTIRGEGTLAEELPSDPPSDDLAETSTAQASVPPCTPEPPSEPRPELPKPTFPDGPQQVLNPASNYRAVIETSCGRLVFQLLEDDAPEAVNSFVFLAHQGFFDGLEVFRNAASISALQTGSGDNTNTWDIGYTLPDEFARAQAEGGYSFGALAMAKSAAPNSAGSQFFMIYGDTTLPPEYTLFGQLVEGSEVLAAIGAIPTQAPDDPTNETPSATVVLESVTIEETPGEPLGPLAPVTTPPLPETTTTQPPSEGP